MDRESLGLTAVLKVPQGCAKFSQESPRLKRLHCEGEDSHIQVLSIRYLMATALKKDLFASDLIREVTSIRGFTAVAFTGNALPIETNERHITVGWCKEVSRDVLFSRHLITTVSATSTKTASPSF